MLSVQLKLAAAFKWCIDNIVSILGLACIRAGMLQCEKVRFVSNLRQLCVQVPIFI
jgi:hypothetical protein